ncbi:hypothetical protein HC891_24110 [Candidatus Gracilibacteria bacterium]|nr:hypothetical protein [Candidatus Gracilibacteria bacterium]
MWHAGTKLRAPLLWITLAGLALWFLIVPQLPFRYVIDVGYEEGYGSDLPYLQDFNTAEIDNSGSYRWTSGESRIVVPGVGQRPIVVQLDFGPVSAEVIQLGPHAVAIWSGGRQLAELPIDGTGRSVLLHIPAELLSSGRLVLLVRSETFAPPGDPRVLGTPLSGVQLRAVDGHLATPDWSALWVWLASTLLIWAILCIGVGDRQTAGGMFVGVAVLIGLAAWLDRRAGPLALGRRW